MSGLLGVYHRDGRPHDSSNLARMAESMEHRGPDGTHIWRSGAIALGHCMLRTTPESTLEKLPYNDNDTGLVITSDARIDNRDDLAKQLDLAESLKSGIPDSQLILAAFNKWGERCVDYLLGDFAFAIWDNNRQRLFCARDIFGVKPFYYYISSTDFVFGSEIRQLTENSLVTLQINEEIITEYLTNYFISKDETYYADIKRLPAAHYMVIESGNVRTCNYWQLKPQKRIWYKHDDEYVEHFLDVFGEAIRCRLRSNSKVGSHLSGGLDSSSIVGMANYLNDSNRNKSIETFSLTFPGRNCDETEFINDVVKKWNCPHHEIMIHEYPMVDWLQHINQTFEIPDPPNQTMMDPLMDEVASNDIHIMLAGIGGDELFSGSPFGYLDLFRKGKIKQFIEEFKYNSQSGQKKTFTKAAAAMLWPIIPESIRRNILCSRRKPKYPPWLSNHVVKIIEERIRVNKNKIGAEFSNLSDKNIFDAIMFPWLANVFELNDRYNSYYRVENRYPFYDRRLVEFALAIPEYERSRKNINKYIVRKAGKYLLPVSVIKRTDKAEFSSAFAEAIRSKEQNNDFIFKEISEKDYFSNEKKLYEIFSLFFEANINTKPIKYLWPLWFTYSINLCMKEIKNKLY